MHTTRHRSTPLNGVIPLTVSVYTASSFAATPALALPPAVNDVAISVVTDPATSFVAGCTTGAVIAGLMVSLATRASRKRLQEQLSETMDALQRAEAAQHAAEQLLHELQLESGVLNGEPYSPLDYVGNVRLDQAGGHEDERGDGLAHDAGAGIGSSSVDGAYATYAASADGNVDQDTQAYDTARENGFAVPAATTQAQAGAPATSVSATGRTDMGTGPVQRTAQGASPARTGAHMRTSAQPAQPAAQAKAARSRQGVSQTAPLAPVSGRRAGLGATGQSVASRIAERYGHARGDTIVIERAKALDDTLPNTFKPQDRPALRYFDPKRRADAINRRVPRLDESLYPDMTAISARDDDPFATAMRAMDRAMGTQRPAAYATGAAGTTGAVRQGAPTAYQGVTGGYGARGSQGRPAAAGLRGTQDLGATRGDLIARSTPMVVSEEEGHVDELVREEFEINRSGASRRYSRSRLTMIDGGDQAASPRRGGRHFANVS